MNTNGSRSVTTAIVIGVVVLTAVGLGWYFWPPADSTDPVSKGPISENKKDDSKGDAPKPGDGKTPPKVHPVAYEAPSPSLAAATEFLRIGQTPVQVGMDPKVLDDKRAAALRGLVFKSDTDPFPGVRIAVRNQPRYGVGASRSDGSYDMIVNGGGILTVGLTHEGYLPVWRQTAVPWQEYTWLPRVVMTSVDPKATPIQSAAKAPQVARATEVRDKNGERQTTLMVPSGTTATVVMPDGTLKPVTTLQVRATEYTVGDGAARLPAALPANAAYAYCVELNADEAVKAGAKGVRFSKVVYQYVENFLEFPVGISVPTGYFDPEKGAWIAADSGRIIKILGIQAELAVLDVEGKGKPANLAALQALNLDDDERKELAKLYAVGTSLWRVPIPHFSVWACAWTFRPPADAIAPALPPPQQGTADDKPVRQSIQGPSVDWKLLYHSDRTPAATDQRTLDIPISGAKIPKSLKRMKLEVFIAGRRIAQSLPVKPEQTYTFTWDGLDAFGRRPAGAQTANLRVGYVYDGVYEQTERFGALGTGVAIDGRRTREEVVLWQEHQIFLGAFDARVLGLGGWCLESQHAYDPVGRILYLGNGERHSASAKGSNLDHLTISTVAGGGPATKLDLGDGGPALAARLENPDSRPGFGLLRRRVPEYWWPRGLAVGPDGTIFIADHNQRIRRVDPDGTITTIAGGGRKTDATGRALEIELIGPRAIALAPDGSMYIAETRKHRIRRLTPDGMLTNIAGASESGGFAGDGGPALKADLNHPTGLAVAPDGTLYIADQSNHRIRRVTPDGVITTIAGRSAKEGYSGDHGLATQAELYWPTSLALAADGSLYVSDQGNYVIRRISPAGVITTVAGNYRKTWSHNFGGDGGSALKADFDEPTGVAIAADGTLYIADQFNHRIRCVGPDGVIRTLAGASQKKENGDFSGDGGPALLAKLSKPTGLAFGPDGSLYFYDASQQPANESNVAHLRQRIRRIAPPMPGFTNAEIAIPSPDGKELIKFDAVGKHLETLDAVTKKTKMRFAYDKAGRLAKIEDAAGQAMTIERDQHGIVNAFVVRRGERTTVKLDANGFLAGLTYPGGNEVRIASTTQGLLKYLHNLP